MAFQARALKNVCFTPFIFWVALFFIGSYFIVSFDHQALEQARKQETWGGYFQGVFNSVRMSHINKGIDIAGGTYLVLSVEVEKALENRLALESRSLDQLFKSKKLKILPKNRVAGKNEVVLTFEDDEAAKICYNLINNDRAGILKAKLVGTAVTVTLTAEIEQAIRTGSVEQAVNVLSARLGGYGVEGIVVQQHGERQVVVQLPGVNDPERVKALVQKTAHLELKIVEATAATKQALLDKFDGELPSDKMIIPGRIEEGESAKRFYLVSNFADLTGEHIVDARVSFDEFNRTEVSFRLDSVGAQEFSDLTGNNVGRQLGIIIDDVMFNAPGIREQIAGGEARITNIQNQKEAHDLSLVLKSGALKAPLKFEHENRVGSSLGQDSIRSGIISCLISLILMFFFSIWYYRVPGFFAVLALLYNLFLVLLFLSYFGATLTLPGLAGMVVSIGMAIDASILIFENIKEELALQAPLRTAINNGFKGVMTVILDSNITTLLTGIILFHFGGPAIKGFAVTLMAGIIATLLAGVYFLRSIFMFALDLFHTKKITF